MSILASLRSIWPSFSKITTGTTRPIPRENEIETERLAGISAWRALVVNHMLANEYRTSKWKRRYKWNANEVAHLMGINVEDLDFKETKKND